MRNSIQFILTFTVLLFFSIPALAQSNLSLNKTLQTARSNSPILKSEGFQVQLAEAEMVNAQLRLNPTLSSETLQLSRPSEFAPNTNWNNGQNREMVWQLTKSFQVAGQRKFRIEVEEKHVQFAQSNYQDVERQLFMEVSEKWLEVWAAQKDFELIQTAKANMDSLTLINQRRYLNQVITQTELFRTELLAKQYALQIKTAQQKVYNRSRELQILIGIKDRVQIDLSDDFIFQFPESIDSLLRQSSRERSDVLSAKSLIEVAGSNVELQKRMAYPQPEVGLIYNPQSTIPFFGVYAAIDIPFFNRNQGEIKKSKIYRDQAEMQYNYTQIQLQIEVENAYASYKMHQENTLNFQEVLEQSQTILDNVKYAYLKGGTTIIDFLEAQRSWLDTQQDYFDALKQYRKSYIQLLYATGLINQLAK